MLFVSRPRFRIVAYAIQPNGDDDNNNRRGKKKISNSRRVERPSENKQSEFSGRQAISNGKLKIRKQWK